MVRVWRERFVAVGVLKRPILFVLARGCCTGWEGIRTEVTFTGRIFEAEDP
jgi:hypothetical protein